MASLAELEKELAAATAAYRDAERRSSEASRAETAAFNRLNDAQKKFDAALDEMRNAAPRGSNWNQRNRKFLGDGVAE